MAASFANDPIEESELLNLLVSSIKGCAIYALDVDGNILTWNDGAEQLKQYKADEIRGKHFSIFYPKEMIESGASEAELEDARKYGTAEFEGWRIRKDGTRFWAHVTITAIYDKENHLRGYSKLTRDITALRAAERRDKVIYAIASEAALASTFDEVLQTAIEEIAKYLGWPLGHAYLWNDKDKVLRSSRIWYSLEEGDQYWEFQGISEDMTFGPGVGLPGQTWLSKNVALYQDISNNGNFPRLETMTSADLHTAVGIPLIEGDRVFAVLEFFSKETTTDIDDIVALGQQISIQVSSFLDRQREAEDQEFFFNSSQDLLCIAGYDGYFKRVNPSWTKILGYSSEELLAHPWLYFIHPDDIPATEDAGDSQVQDAATVVLENRYRCKDGSYRWLQWHSVPVPGREMIYAIARDVTDQKAAEKRLQETLSLQQAILDGTSYGILSVDINGMVRTFNAGAEKMFGYKAEEFVGVSTPPPLSDRESWEEREKSLSETLGRKIEYGLDAFIALAQRGTEEEFEWTYQRSDGTRFPALLTVTALRDENDEVTGYMGIIRDITANKAAEAERTRLLTILEESPDLIAFGCDGTFVYQNKGGNRLRGYPDDYNMAGKKGRDYQPEWVRPIIEEIALPEALEKGVWQGETVILHKDGHEIPVSQVIVTLPSNLNESQYYATIIRDITELKKTDARLAEHARDLKLSNQELEQFAYVASHDLQEPLRMVCSFLGLLEIEHGDKLNDEAKEYVRYAVDGGMRMRGLIDGLLDFSRVGRQTMELKPTDMESIYADATTNLRVAITEAKAEITHDPLPTVMGDRTSLTRLLQNLMSNALKFRGDGPVKIHVGVKDIGTEYEFFVRDNGIGIDPKHEEKIFMIFQRLHSKTKYPGSGIGLSICRKIVERHDGRLWLDTDFTGGAQFIFRLHKESN